MALAVDSEEATNTGHFTTTSPLTWTFANTAGSVLYVLVSASSDYGTGTTYTTTAVSYNTVAMTQVGVNRVTGNKVEVSIWRLLSPATGSHTVSVTSSIDGAQVGIIAGAISFSGNDTGTPEGTAATASSLSGVNSGSVTIPSTTSGNIALAVLSTGTSYSSTINTLTWSLNQNTFNAGNNAAATRQLVSASTTTMTDTISNDVYQMVALEVHAAAGGGSGLPPGLGPSMEMDTATQSAQASMMR